MKKIIGYRKARGILWRKKRDYRECTALPFHDLCDPVYGLELQDNSVVYDQVRNVNPYVFSAIHERDHPLPLIRNTSVIELHCKRGLRLYSSNNDDAAFRGKERGFTQKP